MFEKVKGKVVYEDNGIKICFYPLTGRGVKIVASSDLLLEAINKKHGQEIEGYILEVEEGREEVLILTAYTVKEIKKAVKAL